MLELQGRAEMRNITVTGHTEVGPEFNYVARCAEWNALHSARLLAVCRVRAAHARRGPQSGATVRDSE